MPVRRRVLLPAALMAALAMVVSLLGVAPASAGMAVSGTAHVQNIGWMAPTNGVIGTTGKSLRLEAVKLSGPLRVSVYETNIGWMPQVDMGDPDPAVFAGTTGRSQMLEGIRIWPAPYWEGAQLEYRAHIQNIGWMPWVKNGEVAGTPGRYLRLEAIEVRSTGWSTTPAPSPAPTTTTPAPAPTTSAPVPPPAAGTTTFGVTADVGMESTGSAVLSSIGKSGVEWATVVGDLSYQSNAAATWCSWVKARIAQPVELVPGNHEAQNGDGPYSAYVGCLPDRMGAQGDYSTGQYSISDGPVRYIAVSPGIALPTGTRTYADGTADRAWLLGQIAEARAQGQWVVVAMHIPCLTLGIHKCEVGSTVTDLALQQGVDVLLTGHDHIYARTHQITGSAAAPVVVDRDSRYAAGAGTVQVIVGNGGHNARGLVAPVSGIWAAGAPGSILGWAKVTASPSELMVQLIRVDGVGADGFIVAR